MAINWNSHVNTKFFGLDGNYLDNRLEVAFKSGRKVYYKLNSIPKKSFALKLSLDDSATIDGRTEFEWFLFWLENVNCSGTVPFYLPDLYGSGQTRIYQFSDMPTWTGQKTKDVSFTLEEA